ncbi:MAG: hypothetical protein ACLGI3_14605 [Actinomycetes bacterium]
MLATLALAPAPARADYHGVCKGSGTSATAGLKAENGEFVYTADVRCPGSRQIVVSDVTLSHYLGPVTLSSDVEPGGSCVWDTTDPLNPVYCSRVLITGRAPASLPGPYRVSYRFSVIGHNGQIVNNRPRTWTWLWNGLTAPAKQCGADNGNRC